MIQNDNWTLSKFKTSALQNTRLNNKKISHRPEKIIANH